MSSPFLPPLNLPRLSEQGTVVSGLGASGSGSISARYAQLRAAGVAAQGALSSRTPVKFPPVPGVGSPKQAQSTLAATSSSAASTASVNNVESQLSNMSFETSASEELKQLNSPGRRNDGYISPRSTAPAGLIAAAASMQSTLLLILPGYTGAEELLRSIRKFGFEIAREKDSGKEIIRKLVFNKTQAEEFAALALESQLEFDAQQQELQEQQAAAFGATEEEKFQEQPVEEEEEAEKSVSEEKENLGDEEDVPIAASPLPPQHYDAPPAAAFLGGPIWALKLQGPRVVRALLSYLDEQEQRAYLYAPFNEKAAANELKVVFEAFRDPPQSTLALIKPDAVASGWTERIMDKIRSEQFEIERVEEHIRFTEEQAKVFYSAHASRAYFPLLIKFISSGPMVALRLRKDNGILAWRKVMGSLEEKNSIRGMYATDAMRSIVHGSQTVDDAARELDYVFNKVLPVEQNSFLLIKPDAFQQREAIIKRLIDEGFDLLRIQQVDRFTTEQIRLFFTHKSQWVQPLPNKEKALPVHQNTLLKPQPPAAGSSVASPRSPHHSKALSSISSPISSARLGSSTHAASTGTGADALPAPPPAASENNPSFDMLVDALQQGPLVAIHVKRAQAVRHLRWVVGGNAAENIVDPSLCRLLDEGEGESENLRAKYGKSVLKNGIYISATLDDSARDLALFFQHPKFFPPLLDSILVCKPDAVGSGNTDAIMQRLVGEGFVIGRKKKILLSQAQVEQLWPGCTAAAANALNADSIFESEHAAAAAVSDAIGSSGGDQNGANGSNGMGLDFVSFMTGAPVMLIHVKRTDALAELARLCGVPDPNAYGSTITSDLPLLSKQGFESLKHSSPNCLRAQFGVDALMDAVWCPTTAEQASRMENLVFHQWNPEIQSTFALIKPDAYANLAGRIDPILERITSEGFEIVRQSKMHFNVGQASEFYQCHQGRIFFDGLIAFMTSGPCYAMELRKLDGINAWRGLIGPTNSLVAKEKFPNSLRALYGTNGQRNAFHGSDAVETASREIDLVFNNFIPAIQMTCCLLKPETLVNNTAKLILKRLVNEGFEIVKQEKMTLTTQQAMRFYAEHAGSLYFLDLLKYMTSGPLIALALRKENAVADLRKLMGTTDSTVAKRTAPNSLRALYGTDKKLNAVHGSENLDAAAREIDLAFNTFSVGIQDTYCMVKPDAFGKLSAIIQRLKDEGFTVLQSITRRFTPVQAKLFYAEHEKAPFFNALIEFMCSGPFAGLVLRKENAVRALRELCGPTSAIEARISDPDSLRALFGTDALRNGIHSSKSTEAAAVELQLIFKRFFVGIQATLVLIQPDAIAKQHESAILDRIKSEGFEVIRKKTISFTPEQAKQFLAIQYPAPKATPAAPAQPVLGSPKQTKKALAAAQAAAAAAAQALVAYTNTIEPLLNFLTSGPCIALEVKEEDGVAKFLTLCGPVDPATAQNQSPNSLRALFGSTRIQNAVYGSPTIEQAKKEIHLVFDEFTSTLLTTIAIIKPDILKKGSDDAMVKRITESGFELIARKKLKLTPAQVKQLYINDVSKPFFKAQVDFMTSGPVLCLALRKNHALSELAQLAGPSDTKKAKKSHPQSLRAQFGTDVNRNAIHVPESLADNAREVALLFGEFSFDVLDA